MPIHYLGIRHHGPGSARNVVAALDALQPNILLIEGPPEGEKMLPWAIAPDMHAPVALLAYVPDAPEKAVFYPFAHFSPEWQAICWAMRRQIPVRFIDMPLIHKLAENTAIVEEENESEAGTPEVGTPEELLPYRNPMAYLADIAGFDDAELWWEHQFELPQHPHAEATETENPVLQAFEAVALAMQNLRAHLPQQPDLNEQRREAFMRRGIRLAQKEQYGQIAVICGAWHVPALQQMPAAKEDDALLKNLPKTKVETTWIPWTYDRLSFDSGYGAGVNSPGWYAHCFEHPTDDGSIWLAKAARTFRKNNIDISSAHIIEAVRLANALAALRNLGKPALYELNEATRAVMCMGDEVPMQLVWHELIVGNTIGQVPEGAPQVPLQSDFDRSVKKFRLKLATDAKLLTLDLREPNDLQKSIFFHRLRILGVNWAESYAGTGKGTFKEEWQLRWSPELSIRLLEKAAWGNTVEGAANQYLIHQAQTSERLDQITQCLQAALPAELEKGMGIVVQRLDELSASTADTAVLLKAFLPLVQVYRYGNVRQLNTTLIGHILFSVFYRLTAGLPAGCTGIDDEQASVFANDLKEAHRAVLLLDDAALKDNWTDTLSRIVQVETAAPVVQGTCCKILYDLQHLSTEQTAQAFSRALSAGTPPAAAAAWLNGFLQEAAATLLFDDSIWHIVNQWLAEADEAYFIEVLPLLRRTVAGYSKPEKQKIAEKAKSGAGRTQAVTTSHLNTERGAQVIPVLETLMALR